MDSCGGQTGKNTSANFRMTNVTVKENSDGRTAANTKENGPVESSTESEYIEMVKARRKKANGSMAVECSGYLENSIYCINYPF